MMFLFIFLLLACSAAKPTVSYPLVKRIISKYETAGHPKEYTLVNKWGYMGKYQFHSSTLRTLGFSKKEIRRYLKDPALQEKAMNRLITWNYNYFEKQGLFDCVGDTINCVVITKEGMLAGAHLLGALAVEHFMWNDGHMGTVKYKGVTVYKCDGNGTPLTKYMNILNE